GNPPYVRQELIAPPLREKGDYTGDEWKRLKDQYKEKLESSVKNIWQDVKVDRRSDLYVYFYYHGLSLLKPGGVLCFISSNSWLDVGYGAPLQEFLLKHMRPIYIIDNLKKRSFKQADVNTVIVLIQRPGGELREPIANQPPEDYTIKFIAFKKPFEEISNAEVFKRIERAHTPIFDDEDFRVFPKRRKELLLEGSEVKDEEIGNLFNVENLEYIGNKWGGKYLRAPEIYFKILEKGKGKLVILNSIAHLQRGLVTGLDTYIFLSEEKVREFQLEKDFLK
ncbi:MAG: Eco57I restriction-modification methylase domain-containing protein, partial [bacterium]